MPRRLNVFLLGALAAFLLVQAAFSLRWQIAHDEAPLLYEAFLMQSEGRMPYRDLFDFQMPGAYAAYYVLGWLSNFGPFRLRVLDLTILAALLALTFLLMRRFGKIPAAASAALFGLMYMQGGAFMALQREYLFLPFVVAAYWIHFRREDLTARDFFLSGFLFALASVMKPHAALGFLPLAAFHMANLGKRTARFLLPAAAGFALPFLLVFLWLFLTNSLAPFLDIALNYWSLYSQINGEMAITPADARLSFLFAQGLELGGYGIWILPSLLGVFLVPQENKKYAYSLAGLAACYAVYPVFTGQFFEYHYIPLAYSFSLLASLALTNLQSPIPNPQLPITDLQLPIFNFRLPIKKLLPPLSSFLFLAAVLVFIRPSNTFIRQIQGKPLYKTADRAALIAKYLENNLQPGDTVQPLDWTGGTLLAMLQTRAPLATEYVFDFYFYHHVSHPYIQTLRKDFLLQLNEKKPRFIVEVTAIDKPWISGEDTSREFPELRAFLNQNYSVQVKKDDFAIYQLNP